MATAGVRGRLDGAAAAFASNARNRNLRRAQLSFLGAWTAEWAFTVGLGIVAYRDGGATAVGLVGLLRMAPSALLAPHESVQQLEGIGPVTTYHVDVAELSASLPPLPPPSMVGRIGRTLGVAGGGLPSMLGLRRRHRTATAV